MDLNVPINNPITRLPDTDAGCADRRRGPGGRGRRRRAGARRRARAPRRSRDVPARQAVRRHGEPRQRWRACERSGLAADLEARGLRVDGMLVTGERRRRDRRPLSATASYGRAIVRRDLDWLLLRGRRSPPGCQFEPGVSVRGAVVTDEQGRRARSAASRSARTAARERIAARVTIAADGRRSTIAFGLGLARHPARPRRWAIGAYFENFTNGVRRGV